MSFRLPLTGTATRELCGDTATLAELLNPANAHKLPDFGAAVRQGRKAIAESDGAIKRIAIICLRADDQRWLITVGARGGWRKEWNFGTGRD